MVLGREQDSRKGKNARTVSIDKIKKDFITESHPVGTIAAMDLKRVSKVTSKEES